MDREELDILIRKASAGTDAESIEADLERLGRMADTCMPEPALLNPGELFPKKGFRFKQIAVFASIAFCLAVSLTLFIRNHIADAPPNLEVIYSEIEKDSAFMAEIETLVESALYIGIYPEKSEGEEPYDFSDEFMELIVPI